jgi:hypothetical protein
MYQTNQEIDEIRNEVEAKQAIRKTSDETKKILYNKIKQKSKWKRFERWFNLKFGWFFKNGMK